MKYFLTTGKKRNGVKHRCASRETFKSGDEQRSSPVGCRVIRQYPLSVKGAYHLTSQSFHSLLSTAPEHLQNTQRGVGLAGRNAMVITKYHAAAKKICLFFLPT